MTEFERKDNEFVAWYPPDVSADHAASVWDPRPTGYYVHIPFCSSICDYCGFSVERIRANIVRRYLDALRCEIERYAETGRLQRQHFACGHFGGGTPSVLDAPDLLAIKDLIHSSFDVDPSVELTVEVNPISFTVEKAVAYAEGGVNRVSFGLQSFDDATLKVIGRPHRCGDIDRTLKAIDAGGFENYSLDIIYGVPGQTEQSLREDLRRAAATGATHISCFRLEIIPFTALKLREAAKLIPERLQDDVLNRMDDIVTTVLTEEGYREYGAFNFARPGYESVHNDIAFIAPQGEYVGFGNSSYSFINDHVYCNHAVVSRYEDAVFAGEDPIALARPLSALDAMARYFVLGVKFFTVPRGPFIERFGLEPEQVFGEILDELVADEMLKIGDDSYMLTRRGRHYVNNVAKRFYVGSSEGVTQYPQFVPTLTATQITRYAEKAVEAAERTVRSA
jgi:oxygen-independent coproporphyrinogen III oxidase